ncbi:SDR family NAD(P)-dependent oxidoreductase [Saccharothrix longispora]|uniref:Acyl transferase domain-containing protein/thioesterase domain-containing protein/NADP-dependent 3-hydroxy acid dehydrogenase YdfG/acyl carrier protein n=1 Tax=Saccharothrix longispora TaxID=33920 RepID=A0ABU1PRY8_9PSEU|nr:SDR family NAD(P)-dependent oxidoreductase [Saccharothrix longispora]MDR6593420.1 acyl transferase domain-containing protein/thioesterase domain-containing protein/NADP-dependent 3-hydroxy acid dehydrogenase YdfG/acyl carrier protein [Saccharothrix longispora]
MSPIAVTAVACRFPGAPDARRFWELLRDGRGGLRRFTDDELDARGVPAALRRHPDYVPVGGIIEGQDLFDPLPFGLTDAEAALMDPQQRLFLECAWQALEQAGHGGGAGVDSVGVFAGAMHSSYLTSNLAGRWDPTGGGLDPIGSLQTAMSTQADYLPLHTAYRLDLTGPAISLNTTCSTSLVAVHVAAQSLLAGECDMALAGGVSLIVPQGHGYRYVPEGIFSVDGRVRAFSAEGTGIVYSQGVGAVVLRRLDDALADGDPVLAVLHGSAVNNDGADKAGFTAPSVRGQARVIAEALAVSGIDPRDVGYVEAHGTGTRIGDPIEVAALRKAFGGTGPAWCGLGSVKSNIGHANSAAGIASFIKAVLAVHERTLPATLHAHPLNDQLGLTGSPFEVVTETRPWDTPPHAGVSSFGIGGTNAHVLIGPAPARPAAEPDPRPQVLVFSAHEKAALPAVVPPGEPWADVAHTLQSGRTHLPHRVAAVALADGDVRFGAPATADTPPRIVFAFPGGGSQHAGMGADLHTGEPVFARSVDECAALFDDLLGTDVRSVVLGDDKALAEDAATGLPALFTVSVATARLLASWGVRPDVLLGHSLGEYAAAVVSSALDLPEAARLVAVRSTAMARAAGGGTMLAVPLGEADVTALLAEHPRVDLAVVNAPDACVVSGPADAVDALAAALTARGARVSRLPLDSAAHSRLIEPALGPMRDAVRSLRAGEPELPVVSSLTAAAVGPEFADPGHWVRQLREPVRFSAALATALAEPRRTVLVQVGPGAALASLARRHGAAHLAATLTTFDTDGTSADLAACRAALGELWAHGVDVDLTALHRPGRRRVTAPGYAFRRRALWVEPREAPREETATALLQVPVWHQQPPLPPARVDGRWLVTGTDAAPLAEALTRAGAEVVADAAGQPVRGVLVVVGERETPAEARTAILDHAALAALDPRPDFLFQVTTGACRVVPGDRPAPATATARALPRVIAQESPGLAWRTVDVPDTGSTAAALVAELADLLDPGTRPGAEVALRDGTRFLRTLAPWPVTPEPPTGGTALVLGGLGDVGLTMAQHLARHGTRVVLTSRSGDDPERAAAVRTLVERGHDVSVRVADAADEHSTRALLDELRPDLVVHAAGVVATADLRPMRSVGPEQVDGHLHAKAGGALALRAAIDALPADARPRTVLLMSSAGTLVGGIGTGPYSASNAFLDALAEGRTDREPRWTSVVWDAWKVGPLGTEREVNLDFALDAATGMTALDAVLAACRTGHAPPVVAVSTTDLRDRVRRAATAVAVEPAGNDTDLGPVESVVAGTWSELFGVRVGSAEADFFALGGHSLVATRMLTALGERYGTRLGLRDLLANPTVGGLAAHIAAHTGTTASPAAPAAVVPGSGSDADGTFPMTRVQHAYWVGRDGGYALGGTACHFALEYDCPDLDLDRYERAWNRVIARHPLLRAIATRQGRMQVLDHVPHYRIRTIDLAAADDDKREQRLVRLRDQVFRRPGPSDRWPLVQVRAARLPGGRTRLFLGVDVLICDAASYWIIDRELQHFYEHPDTDLPEVDVTFADCVAALDARRGTPGWQRAAEHWRARLDDLPGAPALPVDTAVEQARFTRRAVRLDRDRWAAFQAAAAEHGVTPTAALLAAYTDALGDWTGQDRFAVTLTLFDRPAIHPAVDSVVGDFTSLLLHETDRAAAPDFAGHARRTQAALFTDLDHREFSALEVLAERATRTGEVTSVPVVFTSAIGLADVIGGDRDLQWAGEQVGALSQTPQTWLDHQVLEQRGELLVQWDALEPVLPPEEVDRAFARYTARLRELTDPAAWGAWPVEDVAVTLREGTGDRTLFLLHPSGGDVLCYGGLSRDLDERLTVVGITDPGLAGHTAPTDLTALARRYAGVLRRVQPAGPYLLGGWSMGGSLGHEVARVLHEQGEHVALLVVLDSNDPTYITPVTGDVEGEVLARHLGALEAYLDVDLGLGGDDRSAFLSLTPERRRQAATERLRAHRLLGAREDLRDRVAVFARHLAGLAAHTPRPHTDPATRTVLLRADRRAPRNSGIGMGVDDTPPDLTDLGWSAHLAGPLDVTGLDADHYSLMRPPAATTVARALDAALKPFL